MSNRAASTAESPAADLPATPVNPASESVSEKLSRPRDDRAVSDRAASDRAASEGTPSGGEGTPSGESGGPAGSEPTRYGDWEKKGRCIDF